MIELPLAGTSYARFQNGLSKAIVSIRKPIRSFSTGGQFVAGRCLYLNEVNNVKDSFLQCEASALFQQVCKEYINKKMPKEEVSTADCSGYNMHTYVLAII